MLNIDGNNNITLTRGDTLTLKISLTKDGEEYIPVDGDVIRFAMAKGYLNKAGYTLLYTKVVPNNTLEVTLTSAETSIDYGTYNYDMQITHGDGTVDTFISASIKIINEVA